MTLSKQLFLKKDPNTGESLSQWWASICHDPRFLMVLTFSRAEMMESRPTAAELQGVELAFSVLLTLSDNEEGPGDYPTPGLHHVFTINKTKPPQGKN